MIEESQKWELYLQIANQWAPSWSVFLLGPVLRDWHSCNGLFIYTCRPIKKFTSGMSNRPVSLTGVFAVDPF